MLVSVELFQRCNHVVAVGSDIVEEKHANKCSAALQLVGKASFFALFSHKMFLADRERNKTEGMGDLCSSVQKHH